MKTATQFRYLFAFELSLFFKRAWIYAVLLTFLGIGLLGGSSFSVLLTENTFRNSPFAITYNLGYLSLICIFSSTILAAQVLFREQEHHFSMVLYATPLKKINFFLSRFLIIFGLNIFTFLLLLTGFAIGQTMSRFDASEFGPFRLWYYFQPFLLITIPNAFFCSAVVCSIGLLTRNKLLVYISGLFIFIAYHVALIFSGSPLIAGAMPPTEESMQMAARFDPFGLSAFLHQTLLWSAIQRNTTVTALISTMLFNRVFYILLSFILLIISHRLFRFSVDEKGRKTKEKPQVKAVVTLYKIAIPQPFSIQHQFRSLISLVKIDLTFVLKSIPFLLILAGIVFVVSMEMYGAIEQGIRIPENYVSTALMVNTILEVFPIFCNLVILFYSNELLWRSRTSNFHLIENTTPVSLSIQFFAKWFSMACIILLLLTGVVLTGILFQIVYQYPHIEWNTYISMGYLVGLPLLLSAGIVIAIQKIIRNRYFALVVATIFVILTTTGIGANIHIRHPLLRIGYPFEGEYSTMSGFGANLTTFSWRMLFGICTTFIIMILAVQFQKGIRKSWNLIVKISLLLLVAIATSSGIYINSQIDMSDKESKLQWQANYEKKYRQFQHIPKPDIKAIQTKIDLFPESNAYNASAIYILHNTTNQPINKLLFYLNPALSLKSLKVDGSKVSTADEEFGHYWVTLSKPLQPQDSIKADFELSYHWNAFTSLMPFNAMVENGAFSRISNYFPQLGYQTGNEIDREVERKNRNLGKATPLKSLEFPREPETEWLNLDMLISTSANQITIGTGELVNQWKVNNRNYFHYKTNVPIRFRFGVSSGNYAIRKVNHRGIGIEVYYHPTHHENVEGLIANAKNTLDYCETNFGKYPFKTIRFAEISAFSKGFAATAYPATIFMTENMVFHANIKGDKQQDVINELAGHELSHEWWGSTNFVPDEREGGRFLSETLAMYTELMLVKKMYGQKRVLENVHMHKNIYLSDRGFSDEQPLYKTNYSNLHLFYSKGMVAMYQLSELIGENKVNAALRHIYQRAVSRTDNILPVTTDFLDELYKLTDASQHPAIDDLFKKIIIYQPLATSIQTRQVGNQYETSFELTVNKYQENGKGKQTPVNFTGTIEIGFSFKDGSPQIMNFRVNHNKATIKVRNTEKPVTLILDPNEKMIKADEGTTYKLK
ncbi:M1 family aminopeptidase [Emticicia sp. BO119]|uniref:ABC transporter permease/M1 family aminopeptidase n=1 Tax=Emticicia sp. BO119 TaxID=2757768 RepID=UPI0015F0326A|nr:M1 family aminopeptidase [Emticicia sp. BO119]MBA4853811.1 aminopeptidase [Emticicia sp. BO119]